MSDQRTVREIVAAAMGEGRTALTAAEAKQVCDAYGIPMPAQGIAKSRDEACAIAAEIGYPVVAKIESRDVLHKTDVGGVIVGLETDEALREFCRGRIAHYKVPRHVRFVAEMPLTATGKPQKFRMRERMMEELGVASD